MKKNKKTLIKYSLIGMTYLFGIGAQALCVLIIYISSFSNWAIYTNLLQEGFLEIWLVLLFTLPASIISTIYFFRKLFKMDGLENGKN